jgi:hypothetical protein
MAVSDLSLITGYNSLNGLYNPYGMGCFGYSGYGMYGMFNGANKERAKTNIANGYDVFATRRSYMSKPNVEDLANKQQCANVSSFLRARRPDDAAAQFESIVREMKSSPNYANYSDIQIRNLVRNQYSTVLGTDVVTDIQETTPGPFFQGVKQGVPVLGTFFAHQDSSEDLIAQTTGTRRERTSLVRKSLGAVASGAVFGAAAGAAVKALGKCKYKSWKYVMLAGAAISAGVGLVKSLFPSHKGKS